MNKQQLANKIWASANKMRSKIEANEYKDYILGLIFYKFLSDNEVNYLKSIGWSDEDMETLVENHEDQEAIMMMPSSPSDRTTTSTLSAMTSREGST